MKLAEISDAAERVGLEIAAAFHPSPEDLPPENCQTLVLLAPHEPGFWARIKAQTDCKDPVDTWSQSTISDLATRLGAAPLFPFGGPPYQPFIRWALASGQVWQSPLGLLVHARQGLFISFRGALAFPQRLALPSETPKSPCLDCADKPCQRACPVEAFASGSYDIPRCTRYLDSAEGAGCLSQGCAIRRPCPVSQSWPRLPEQSAHHMEIFLRANR